MPLEEDEANNHEVVRSDGGGGSRRAVFLDRDGVINRVVFRCGRPASPRNIRELVIEPGVSDALELLACSGFRIFVATNQPDLARGLLPPEEHAAMLAQLYGELPMLERIMVCPHDDRHHCGCRKPGPGMLLTLSRQEGLELASCWMVGDSARDVDAARLAGCRSILLERFYNAGVRADYRSETLLEAVGIILSASDG